MDLCTPGFPILHYLLELVQTHVHWINAIQPSHCLSFPPPLTPQTFLTSGSFPMSFSFSISPSNKYSGLISFKIDWLDLLAVQGTLKSLLQHHSSNSLKLFSFLYGPTVNLYMTAGKTITLFRSLFAKWCPCFSNMFSRFVIAFLSKIKHLSISWLQSPFTVILEPKNMKCASFHFFPINLALSDGPGCHNLSFFWMLSFKLFFSLSSVTLIRMLFSSSSISAIREVLSAYLKLLVFLPVILIPVCDSSSLAFHMVSSAYK